MITHYRRGRRNWPPAFIILVVDIPPVQQQLGVIIMFTTAFVLHTLAVSVTWRSYDWLDINLTRIGMNATLFS